MFRVRVLQLGAEASPSNLEEAGRKASSKLEAADAQDALPEPKHGRELNVGGLGGGGGLQWVEGGEVGADELSGRDGVVW